MNFRKKLKIRLGFAISYIILGVLLIALAGILRWENTFASAYGLTLTVIGFARLKQYCFLTKDEQRLKKQEIIENDERNIAISQKAKAVTFNISVIAAALATIVLQIIGKNEFVDLLGGAICILIAIYWISYFILRKKL